MAAERIRRILQHSKEEREEKSKFQRESWEKMQGWESRVCTAIPNPEVREKFSNWDVEAKNAPKLCFAKRRKNQMDYFHRKLQHGVCTQPKPVLTDVCAKIFLPLFASATSPSLYLPAFLPHSLSLSLSASSPLLSLLRGLADLGAYVFIKTAVRSSKWKGRKKERGRTSKSLELDPRGSCTRSWVSTVCLLRQKKETLSTCYGLFCYILSSLTQMSSTIPSLKIICSEDQTHRSLAANH